MVKQNLLKKLADEKFNGKLPDFQDAKFDQVKIQCYEDDNYWYMFYSPAPTIIVQEKAMKKPPHCYVCKSSIKYVTRFNSVHFSEFKWPVGGGEVRKQRIPYCPKCNEKPTNKGVIKKSDTEYLD